MDLVNLDKEQQYNDAPPGPWTNNVCSSATRGIMLEQAVEDRPPIKSRVVPQFGLSNGRQAAGVNGNTLIECVPVIFDGWKMRGNCHKVICGKLESVGIFFNRLFFYQKI